MRKITINKTIISFRFAILALVFLTLNRVQAQEYREDPPLTFRPLLQELGTDLMQGKKGSIVAIDPATGEVLCMVTNSPTGPNDALAIATAYPPGSAIKPAQALVFLSEGIVKPDTKIACHDGFRDGNIKVKCHPHYSPEALPGAIAVSCNTWFLKSYLSMLSNTQKYGSKEKAVTTWWEYITSMGLGGPLGIDMAGEKGGLVANVNYLSRRYKNNWEPKTIMWAGMGQGDITATPLQLCNLAVTIANRGYFFTPHIHKSVDWAPLPSRFLTPRQTKVPSYIYSSVINGMRLAVTKGTATVLNGTTYPVCGKTGTAENAGKDHSVFIGFAPMNEPKIAISVYIEHGGFGADVAAPIAGLIMEKYLKGKLSPKSQAMAKRIERINTMDK
ncbi:penicillin-binding transpeptidase domain-containing protein [Prevotella melaninogenica]|uniref:Penicillin-binding protein 2 n=1 Tax=Prevotella melaninogenica TaxID=28132 RepID=A0A250KKN5_9BACT|nr:penicillin-binding transpeptidase domain-containing protein [Prevotella melaninogenica]BBA30337.1 penicillin-binding protein 2 [Prevotella melaninogenica]